MPFAKRLVLIIRTGVIVSVLAVFVGIGPVALAEEIAQPTDTTSSLSASIESQPVVSDSNTNTAQQSDSNSLESSPEASTNAQQLAMPTETDEQTASNTANSTDQLQNTATQESASGSTDVSGNDDVANVSTGSADNSTDIVNLANNLQNFSGDNTTPNLYIMNVNGSQVGDIVIDPASISDAYGSSIVPTSLDNSTVTIVTNTLIDNQLSQNAQTGDANVSNNDNVGNVSTGDASNNVDIINIANTIIGTGNNFVGIINVFGDFQGNIVLPANLLNNLTAQPSYGSVSANVSNNTTVNNSADMSATTGSAAVYNNDIVSSVTTGDATNLLLIKNYIGQHVFTQNALLIIVNVGGNWYGLLLGSTDSSSALVPADGTESAQPTNPNNSLHLNIDVLNNTTINNALLMNATSGNANVTNNDNVGNVKTGNATNTARIMNITNTVVSLAQWFGILFINILGNWYGNVALAPLSSTPEPAASSTSISSNVSSNTTEATQTTQVKHRVAFNRFSGLAYTAPANSIGADDTNILSNDGFQDDYRISNSNLLTNSHNNASYYWAAIAGLFGISAFGGFKAYQLKLIR